MILHQIADQLGGRLTLLYHSPLIGGDGSYELLIEDAYILSNGEKIFVSGRGSSAEEAILDYSRKTRGTILYKRVVDCEGFIQDPSYLVSYDLFA